MELSAAASKSLRLNGATRSDRFAATARLSEIVVSECRGWIGEFYQYSNTSLCLHFELPAETLPVLRPALQLARIKLASESDRALESLINAEPLTEAIQCTLQLTFIHNEPDLRRQAAAVPG